MSSPVNAATNIPAQAWSRDINAGGYLDGAPLGGFGAGTVTRNFGGDFYLGRLNVAAAPTTWTNNSPYVVDANCGFYMYQKPSGGAAVTYHLNATALGTGQATYYSLYPKSWVDYYGSDFACKARVSQFTPMIPGDYIRSSFPEGIFEWDIYNPTCTTTDVGIMLTWDNTFGGANAAVSVSGGNTGLVLTRSGASATTKSQGEFALACASSAGVTVTYQSAASVANLQTSFGAAGTLTNAVGANSIGGIAFKVTLSPGQSVKIPIVLAWDIPLAQPGTGAQWYREYTRTYGKTGLNSFAIANDALNNYAGWETSIDNWQGGVLGGPYPDWFKQMLFNELYYYVIGGTLWEAGQYGSTNFDAGPDMFSSLESYVYPFYGTSDVRFYSSWALAQNWPNIDKQEVEQFCDSVTVNASQALPRPAAIGTCAHDFGALNDVYTRWNAYTFRDSTTWKDLNSKLVLMVYRDWEMTGKSDSTFLNYCWPAVQMAMAKVHSQCVSTGPVTYNLPISNGIDQTYDNLGLTGETAYCGSLYLAACEAAQAMATQQGNAALATTYNSWLTLGQADFEGNLWNATGNYYNIDTGSGAGGVTGVARIMSDQLCGQWYAKACGLSDVVPAAHAVSAWQTVHDNNWAKFDAGAHGEVNVMTSAGSIDASTSQSQEAWVGTTWGAVAGMIQQGMFTQAVSIGNSLYNSIWNLGSMWFRTPEAWTTGLTNIRAPYYMRANAIWGAKHAYDVNSPCGNATCTPIPTLIPTPTAMVSCPGTPTFTFTNTTFLTPTRTPTNSPSATLTRTATNSPTRTATATPTPSASNTSTRTSTPTLTNSPSSSPTASLTLTPPFTSTASATPTKTPSNSPTNSLTMTVTNTVSRTPTNSPTQTPTNSPANTSTATASNSPTGTPTHSPTPTITSTPTNTPLITNTSTQTPADSMTPSPTNSATASLTATPSASPTPTKTETLSPTNSFTSTASLTATNSPTKTPTSTPTLSFTNTATLSPTNSPSSTKTNTATSSPTTTPTNSSTNTSTVTASNTPSGTPTQSHTSTISSTPTNTPLITNTPTQTPTSSMTPTASLTASRTPTNTPSKTPTQSPSNSPTLTSTNTVTLSPINTFTFTSTFTRTFTLSNTFTSTPTTTSTATASNTSTPTNTLTFTPSPTSTFTSTATFTTTPTNSSSPTALPTMVVILPPYPNPSRDGSPVTIGLLLPGPASLHWSVFTTAFRKIKDESTTLSGSGNFSWDLKDKLGAKVADGLYYLRVEVKGDFGKDQKILKVLVLP